MLSACWLIGAYFLAVSSHKRGRLKIPASTVFHVDRQTYTKLIWNHIQMVIR